MRDKLNCGRRSPDVMQFDVIVEARNEYVGAAFGSLFVEAGVVHQPVVSQALLKNWISSSARRSGKAVS